jgi:putative membrane protein
MTGSWITRLAAVAAAFALAAPLPAQAQTQRDTSKNGAAALTDESFVQQALKSGENEVAMAKLAAEKATASELKQLAEMLAQDHGQVNEQLRLIAQKSGGPKQGDTPSAPGQRSESGPPGVSPGAGPATSPELEKLSKLSGPEFDKEFLAAIVAGHEKSVELYEKASTQLKDGAAKKLATDTLPKIKEHLQQAKSLLAQKTKP